MAKFKVEVEVTVSTIYKKTIEIERYDYWEPSELGKPQEGEDFQDVKNRLLSEQEADNLFQSSDLNTYKQEQEIEYNVLSISKEGSWRIE